MTGMRFRRPRLVSSPSRALVTRSRVLAFGSYTTCHVLLPSLEIFVVSFLLFAFCCVCIVIVINSFCSVLFESCVLFLLFIFLLTSKWVGKR